MWEVDKFYNLVELLYGHDVLNGSLAYGERESKDGLFIRSRGKKH